MISKFIYIRFFFFIKENTLGIQACIFKSIFTKKAYSVFSLHCDNSNFPVIFIRLLLFTIFNQKSRKKKLDFLFFCIMIFFFLNNHQEAVTSLLIVGGKKDRNTITNLLCAWLIPPTPLCNFTAAILKKESKITLDPQTQTCHVTQRTQLDVEQTVSGEHAGTSITW